MQKNYDGLKGQLNTVKRFRDNIEMQFSSDTKVAFRKGSLVKSKNITLKYKHSNRISAILKSEFKKLSYSN